MMIAAPSSSHVASCVTRASRPGSMPRSRSSATRRGQKCRAGIPEACRSRLSSRVWGAWSLSIQSMIPARSACSIRSGTASGRSGGLVFSTMPSGRSMSAAESSACWGVRPQATLRPRPWFSTTASSAAGTEHARCAPRPGSPPPRTTPADPRRTRSPPRAAGRRPSSRGGRGPSRGRRRGGGRTVPSFSQ